MKHDRIPPRDSDPDPEVIGDLDGWTKLSAEENPPERATAKTAEAQAEG